jgi:hypothetical protein
LPILGSPIKDFLESKPSMPLVSSKLLSASSSQRLVKIAPFDGLDSGAKLAKGLGNGMVDVLPDESFLKYCRDNATQMSDAATELNTDYADG